MVFGLFKKKPDHELHARISTAFSKVDSDISQINRWLQHIDSGQHDLHGKHAAQISLTQKEVADLKQWVSFLHSHLSTLHSSIKQTSAQTSELKHELAELKKQVGVVQLAQTSVITHSITPRNQAITPQLRHVIGDDTHNNAVITCNSHVNLSALDSYSSSEKEVISTIYASEKPLTYGQIAKLTGLNYGTVKNIIYKIRKKGLDVCDQVTPDGEKEFFLTNKVKIELSGR